MVLGCWDPWYWWVVCLVVGWLLVGWLVVGGLWLLVGGWLVGWWLVVGGLFVVAWWAVEAELGKSTCC